jgi:hypothetical protein
MELIELQDRFNEVNSYANIFRNAIESVDNKESPASFFERFPRGCCGDASDLLSKYLASKEIRVEYVWGINSNRASHAWLEYRGLVIDLTADQFPEINEKVIITKDKSWYSQFKNQTRSISNFEEFNNINETRLSALYSIILKKIQTI